LPKIERCLERLTDEQIWWRPNSESNSIGNLTLHLCGNARQWIISGLGNQRDQRTRDQEFSQTEIIPREKLLELLRGTLAEVMAVLNALNPQALLESRTIQGCNVDVVHAIYHVTEHFSMHTGQIILMTKILADRDLGFYDFSSGVPQHRWNEPLK
jgi:uncharacterized damage-inducible protein DinB